MAEAPCDSKDIAIAALANLVRLMGAELVAGRHRDDIDVFERAVRAKIDALDFVETPDVARDDGLTLARSHVERVLTQIRRQALDARSADLANAAQSASVAAMGTLSPILH